MALGAILGLAGSVLTNVTAIFKAAEDRKLRKLELAHEEKSWEHEAHLFELQSQAKVAETEQEAFLITTQGSFDGLKASITDQTETAKRASRWTVNILTLFRPMLTTAFTGITIFAAWQGLNSPEMAAGLGVEVNRSLMSLIKDNPALIAIYGLCELSVTWWFGDRSSKRVIETMRGGHIRAAGGQF